MLTKANNGQKERVKRHHPKVRSGCKTCRTRRVKCDETKPHCLRCLKAARKCEGYEIEYIRLFVPKGSEDLRDASLSSFTETKINAAPLYNPLPSTSHPEIADRLVKHALFKTWPALVKLYLRRPNSDSQWYQAMVTSPMYYHANIYSLSNICEHVLGVDTPAFNELRLWAYSKALQAIQEEVRQVLQQDTQPRDIVIRSIVLLAANKLQRLEHEDGLQMLIEKRGGISTLSYPEVIIFRDIVVSTLLHRPPRYPISHLSSIPSILPQSQEWPLRSASRKPQLDEYSAAVLQLMRQFVTISAQIEDHQGPDNLASPKVFFARAEVQHKILSLPESWLKTAILIFTHLVIFPLNPKLQLCAKYSSRLERQVSFDMEEDFDSLRLWAVTIAGMVSSGATRLALARVATRLCPKSEINGKDDVLKAVQSVLWSNIIKSACLIKFVSLVSDPHDDRNSNASVRYLDETLEEDFVSKVPQSAALVRKIADDYVLGM